MRGLSGKVVLSQRPDTQRNNNVIMKFNIVST